MTGDQQHPAIPPALLTADPGLPLPDPTRSYWQRVPHPLANVQSSSLQQADVAVIGSGITGLSVSKTLLERDLSARVTVLEARTLCSGATGRNGGQLAANAGEEYARLAQAHGPEMAGKIVNFTFQNLHKMHELIQDVNEDSEYQQVQKLRVFLTADVFESFKRSIARMEADHSSLRGLYTILDATAVLEVCRGLASKTQR
jgi:glycine/D-amino acid oxidase-like deaminating enzyme